MDATRTLIEIVLGAPAVLAALGVGALAALLVGGLARRAWGWTVLRSAAVALATAGLALVLATTLVRTGSGGAGALTCLADVSFSVGSAEEFLNLVLMAPMAFFATVATRRPAAVAFASVLLAVAIEVTQGVLGSGTCQAGDMVRNLLGAAGGVLAAWLLAQAAGVTDSGAGS